MSIGILAIGVVAVIATLIVVFAAMTSGGRSNRDGGGE